MEFSKFNEKLTAHFAEMSKENTLYEVDVDKDEMWELYLNSFPAGTNEIYRVRREYDCSCCRHFMKSFGNVVVIKDNKIITLWDFDAESTTFQPVVDALRKYISGKPITNVHICKEKKIGTKWNYEAFADGNVKRWYHFYLEVPDKFVNTTYRSIGDIQGEYRSTYDVFLRSLNEITSESVETVLELIASNSLYKGAEWENVLKSFLIYKRSYVRLSDAKKKIFAWDQSVKAGAVVARLRNHSIGTLLVDISNNVDLDTAVRKYESIVAPSNYKRPKAIFTQKMLNDAKKTIEDMGYMDSLVRRYATLDDITINNILFSNRDAAKRVVGAADIFDVMSKDVTTNPKKFSKVEEISINDFVANVLPHATDIEAYVENAHINNMVSLIAPINVDSKTMFKWNNNFSWAYTGNVTDSMKERVKTAGGRVDGDLRFSIQWNEDGEDNCDLDAHCIEANGFEICYGSARKPKFSPTRGQLDVDIIDPRGNIAVENITWASRHTMKPGKYKFFVRQFSGSVKKGFRAEIEFDGQIYSYDYPHSMHSGLDVYVADVILDNNWNFSINHH